MSMFENTGQKSTPKFQRVESFRIV